MVSGRINIPTARINRTAIQSGVNARASKAASALATRYKAKTKRAKSHVSAL
jgi:hypothetical protein